MENEVLEGFNNPRVEPQHWHVFVVINFTVSCVSVRLSRVTNCISPWRLELDTHETDMAAVAALSCPAPPRGLRCAKTLPAPSAATSSRGRVGYGSSYARRWQCRRWAHRPDAATTRIRRATPRRTAVVRVNCAYSPRGKGLVAADRSPWSFISHALLLLALVAYGGFTAPWKVP